MKADEVGQVLWDLGPIVDESEVEHTITCHASQLADHYRDVCARVRALVEAREDIEAACLAFAGRRKHDIEIVEAPGDRCGNTRKLPDGSRCPGCRACS